jgi:DNA segregation ATPase FtsK/SpoIIIE, S-DNA-T family
MTRNREVKSGKSSSGKSGLSGMIGKLSKWERIGGILAILLFFTSVYLLISFISFLFSGGADQSLLEATTKEILTNSKIKFVNAGGRFGAILANMFINKAFGFASLGIVFLLIILSLKLARIGKVSLSGNFAYGLFLIVLTSISSAYFLSSFY